MTTDDLTMQYPRLDWQDGSAEEFVNTWAPLYPYPDEELYLENITAPLTPDAVRKLFLFKNGGKLAAKKQASVEANYVDRLDELRTLPADLDGREFLRRWNKGGAIWRIFWLHCWNPRRFPIYDQHVHRAAALIADWPIREIPKGDQGRLESYFNLYMPFWSSLGINNRDADRALFTFGKFMKDWGRLLERYAANMEPRRSGISEG